MPHDSSIPAQEAAEFARRADSYAARFRDAVKAMDQKIVGQEKVIENCIITLLAGGHSMLNGVPGLAKTKLVVNLAAMFGLAAKKQQFTPDLLPQNLKGSEVVEEDGSGNKKFRFVQGPIFAQLFMADEINRAGGRVQSGLLEAMQEKKITYNGEEHDLPEPFHTLATLNPLDQEGTFPLTEANKDRFLMEIKVHRPSREAEKRIILGIGRDNTLVDQFFTDKDLIDMQKMVARMPVPDGVADAVLDLVRHSIPDAEVSDAELKLAKKNDPTAPLRAYVNLCIKKPEDAGDGGGGIRASMALLECAKARAFMQGRLAPSLDDVLTLAEPVLRHRLAMTFEANAIKMTPVKMIRKLTESLKPQP